METVYEFGADWSSPPVKNSLIWKCIRMNKQEPLFKCELPNDNAKKVNEFQICLGNIGIVQVLDECFLTRTPMMA